MHHVFVSYSRADAEWVTALTRRLEAAGHATWLDQRDIPMTLPWIEEIGDAIAATDLFLICDSPASRESAHCGAEATLAFDAGKRSLEVKVGDDLAVASAAVDRAVAQLEPAYRMRTELAVLARDWERGGRERSALVSARARRRLAAGAAIEPPLGGSEQAFLQASRRRSRRRAAVSVLVGLVIGVSLVGAAIFNAALKKSQADNDEQAVAYTDTRQKLASQGDDPYLGLGEAAALGQNESATDAIVLTRALGTPVPDDAFRVPAGAIRFASTAVGGTVRVATTDGSIWQRGAAARDVRSAHQVHAELPTVAIGAVTALRLRPEPRSGVVDVFRDGTLWRRIAFSQEPRVLGLSPDGRELAAARGNLAEIADLQLGSVRTTVSGAAGPIRDLAWSRDGRRLWALGRKLVVSWPVRDGAVLADDPGERFEALLPAAGGAAVWAVASDGELRELDVDSGRVLARLRVPDRILSGGGAPDGSVAALSGERGLWIVPLDGGRPRLMRIPDCTLGRATLLDAETIFLPCLSGDLLRISAARAQVEQHIEIARVGAYAARALPRHGALLVSDTLADMFWVTPRGEVSEVFRSKCGGSIIRFAVDPSETVVAPTGSGTGISGCIRRGVLRGGDPADRSDWSFVAVDDEAGSALAEASAVSRDGDIFAYGYSDGTVILHPTRDILPALAIRNVVGEIRDMYVTPGNQLLVATAAGIVQRIPLCGACLSNRSLARVAAARIRRGIAIGTAVRG